MYDIFEPSLESEAKKRSLVLVRANRIEKPQKGKGFTMAASTDRAMLKAGVHMLYNLELLDERKDNVHHRNSGLDSTLAKLCAQQDVLIGINLRNVRSFDPKIIGRIMQNIVLCRTHKTPMAVFSDATNAAELPWEGDVHALLKTLGMSSQQAKAALRNLERVAKPMLEQKQSK